MVAPCSWGLLLHGSSHRASSGPRSSYMIRPRIPRRDSQSHLPHGHSWRKGRHLSQGQPQPLSVHGGHREFPEFESISQEMNISGRLCLSTVQSLSANPLNHSHPGGQAKRKSFSPDSGAEVIGSQVTARVNNKLQTNMSYSCFCCYSVNNQKNLSENLYCRCDFCQFLLEFPFHIYF